MIEVRYQDRLGNNLFQYCMGRILAEELGFGLKCDPLPGFPNTSEIVAGNTHDGPLEIVTGHAIPFRSILKDPTPRHIVLAGWFQRAEFYKPYRDRIRRWLEAPRPHDVASVSHDLVVHVRRTDYIANGWALPFSYYQQAIDLIYQPGMVVSIATDDPHDPFFDHFKRWRPVFLKGGVMDHFEAMRDARNLVMSQSSYSWWAAFLSKSQRTICPIPISGVWSQSREIERGNLLVDSELFECLECEDIYRPTIRELLYQKKLTLIRRLCVKLGY
jgi:hypothetical protein